MINSHFTFNKLYFIVSDKEDRVAKGIFADIVRVRCEIKNISSEYIDINSKEDFKEMLLKIERNARENEEIPFLHFECHGSPDGIILKSTGKINWGLFANLLTRINVACKNNLFVSMASCYGGYLILPLIKKLTEGEKSRAPYFGYIGPTSEIKYGELEDGFSKFFDVLLDTLDMDKSIEMLNKFSNYKRVYSHNSCKGVFDLVIEYFLSNDLFKKFNSKLSFTAHIRDLAKQYFRETGRIPTHQDYNRLSSTVADKKFYLDYFNKMREDFFMIDLYPEIEDRFEKIDDIKNWHRLMERIL